MKPTTSVPFGPIGVFVMKSSQVWPRADDKGAAEKEKSRGRQHDLGSLVT